VPLAATPATWARGGRKHIPGSCYHTGKIREYSGEVYFFPGRFGNIPGKFTSSGEDSGIFRGKSVEFKIKAPPLENGIAILIIFIENLSFS